MKILVIEDRVSCSSLSPVKMAKHDPSSVGWAGLITETVTMRGVYARC